MDSVMDEYDIVTGQREKVTGKLVDFRLLRLEHKELKEKKATLDKASKEAETRNNDLVAEVRDLKKQTERMREKVCLGTDPEAWERAIDKRKMENARIGRTVTFLRHDISEIKKQKEKERKQRHLVKTQLRKQKEAKKEITKLKEQERKQRKAIRENKKREKERKKAEARLEKIQEQETQQQN